MEQRIKEVLELLDFLIQDPSIPKNVRKALEKAKGYLNEEDKELVVRATSAIYEIDEIVDDTNLPHYARTHIWRLLSSLESLKE